MCACCVRACLCACVRVCGGRVSGNVGHLHRLEINWNRNFCGNSRTLSVLRYVQMLFRVLLCQFCFVLFLQMKSAALDRWNKKCLSICFNKMLNIISAFTSLVSSGNKRPRMDLYRAPSLMQVYSE